jgi:hypothetical protein
MSDLIDRRLSMMDDLFSAQGNLEDFLIKAMDVPESDFARQIMGLAIEIQSLRMELIHLWSTQGLSRGGATNG